MTLFFEELRIPWYRRAWMWIWHWRARRIASSYTIISEQLADVLYAPSLMMPDWEPDDDSDEWIEPHFNEPITMIDDDKEEQADDDQDP